MKRELFAGAIGTAISVATVILVRMATGEATPTWAAAQFGVIVSLVVMCSMDREGER